MALRQTRGGSNSLVSSYNYLDSKTYRINFNPLIDGAKYRLTILGGKNFKDVASNALASDLIVNFRVGSPYTTPPNVATSSITNGADGVDVNTTELSFVFDHSMDMSLVAVGDPYRPKAVLEAHFSDPRTLVVSLNTLEDGGMYTVIACGESYLRDTSGNFLPSDYQVDFRVGSPYTTTPQVISSSIANGAVDVDIDTSQITFTFDHSMYQHSVSVGGECIADANWQDWHTLVVQLNPLVTGTPNSITLWADGTRDTSGNNMTADYIFSFTAVEP